MTKNPAPCSGTIMSGGVVSHVVCVGDPSKMMLESDYLALCESFEPGSWGPQTSGFYEWRGNKFIVWNTGGDGNYPMYDRDMWDGETPDDYFLTDTGLIACIPEAMVSGDRDLIEEDCAFYRCDDMDEDHPFSGWDVEVSADELRVEWYTIMRPGMEPKM